MDLDASLTPLGRQQARATADYLAANILRNLSATPVLVSPFRRTLQTCEPLTTEYGCRAELYPEMCEYFSSEIAAYASFCGLSPAQIDEHYPKLCKGNAGLGEQWWPSNPEDLEGIYRRVRHVRDDLVGRYGSEDRQVVIFSHAEPIGRLIEVLLGDDPNPGWPPWTQNCGINRLTIGPRDQYASALALNDISHLEALGLVSPVNP